MKTFKPEDFNIFCGEIEISQGIVHTDSKEEHMRQLALIDFMYTTQRNDIHAEFHRTRDHEKFNREMKEIQDLRYRRIKGIFICDT